MAADLLSRKPAATPIHAPPRGATCAVPADFNELLEISIHAPPRGATCLPLDTAALTHFNSRPSARGDIWYRSKSSSVRPFQFTPLREGRPVSHMDKSRIPAISIHAPPRGATLIPIWETQVDKFQFTPLCEGRRYVAGDFLPVQYFNSRPSARGDEKNLRDLRQEEISIHAPPRGATCLPLDTAALTHFNSRPSARGDLIWGWMYRTD